VNIRIIIILQSNNIFMFTLLANNCGVQFVSRLKCRQEGFCFVRFERDNISFVLKLPQL